jgi:predicted trehalose synthase
MTEPAAIARLVSAWVTHRPPTPGAPEPADAAAAPDVPELSVEVREVEVLRAGRPGLLDVIAEVEGRTAHAVLGLRRPGDEAHLLRVSDDPVLGLLDDEHGLGVVVDALRDAELAPMVLAAVTGTDDDPGPVAPVADDDEAAVLAFGDRYTLSVFPWLDDGPNPAVALLVALDDAGFNHLPAPLALWRRGGRDLGLVQEQLAGSAGGWALALTSLRDLYASGGPPEKAGGDFAPEARALGTMTARMHLALDRAFGRRSEQIAEWVDRVEAAVRAVDPQLLEAAGVADALEALQAADLRAPVLQTHGDFHLGRTARTDQGWVVADCAPGGIPPGCADPVRRSPLGDVADLLWSLHRVATEAAFERDPTGRAGLAALARAWEARNRRAFVAGYLATPGIGGLVPTDREVVGNLAAAFELERVARLASPAEAAR